MAAMVDVRTASRQTGRPRLALGLIAVLGAACGSPSSPGPLAAPAAFPAPAPTRDGRFVQDVDYLSDQLARLHPNLFFQTPRADFERAAAELRAAIPTLQDHEVLVGLMHLAALPGDGHTSVGLSSGFQTLPLRLAFLAGGLYVVAADAERSAALGARVVAIGGHDVAEAEAAIAPLVSHENEAWLRVRTAGFLVVPEILHAVRLVPDRSLVPFLLEDERGARFSIEVPSMPRPGPSVVDLTVAAGASLPLHRQRSGENYWYTLLPDTGTLYFAYNRCQNAPETFATVADRVLRLLDQGQAARLVVDVRHNAGGDSSVDDALIRGLESRSAWRTRGRLFCLIGGETFSSGLWSANDLHKLGAVLIGEPTGGKPNSYGNVRTFNLPSSGLLVQYSTTYFRLLQDSDPSSLFPELRLTPTIADYRAGRDPLLEAALAFRP
jgi:hypothetical protein